MGALDFTELTGSTSQSTLDRGVTSGIASPYGGGTFVYGYNSLSATSAVHGMYCNLTDFAPMAKGGSIRGAVVRHLSGGPMNFSPFLFIGLQGPATTDVAYMLGLQDDDPHRIVLRKGTIAGGIPNGAAGNGILRRSTATYGVGTWLHLRLDMIVNSNGDVILIAKQNDLALHSVSSPTWVDVPGIGSFTDDALGINSGSQPLTAGRAGWGCVTRDVSRRAAFDSIEIYRQT